MSAAGAAAAAAEARRRREEEEALTGYTQADLADDWEFKILRSATRTFKDPARLRQALDEEARAGWMLVEKFDNQRLRLKRPAAAKAGDSRLDFDPYRTTFGMSDQKLAAIMVCFIVSIVGTLILIAIFAAHMNQQQPAPAHPGAFRLFAAIPNIPMPTILDRLRSLWFTPAPQPPPQVSDMDLSMMRRALTLAQAAAAMGEVPVGAVVYRTTTGEVLGEAHNRRESDKDPSAHAEHIAMVAASRTLKDWRLTGCSLAVTLEPCPMCAGLIVNSRIDRVIYGAKDPKAGAMGSLMRLTEDPRLNHRVTPITGVLADESAALLKDFFRKIRSQK